MNRSSIAPSRNASTLRVVLATALATLSTLAAMSSAAADTWKWRDASGQFAYSDLPPPPGTVFTGLAGLNHGVRVEVQAQAERGHALEQSSAASSEGAAAPARPPVGSDWVEREKISRQRAAERAEAEQRQIDEMREAAEAARICEDAATDLRTLVRGVRLATVNARGETEVMDHAERTRRIDSIRQTLAGHCGAHH
jgi:hypothetical protein